MHMEPIIRAAPAHPDLWRYPETGAIVMIVLLAYFDAIARLIF